LLPRLLVISAQFRHIPDTHVLALDLDQPGFSQMVQDASIDTMSGEQATRELANLSAELDQVIKQFKLR